MGRRFVIAVALVSALALAVSGAFAAGGTKPKTTRVSVKANGGEAAGAASDYAAVSANGRLIAYESSGRLTKNDKDALFDVYVYDRVKDRSRLVSVDSKGKPRADIGCAAADMSPNGRYVSFGCDGALVDGDTNGIEDVYRRDLKNGKTIRVSLTDDDLQLAGIDDDSEISGVTDNGLVAWESYGAFVNGDTNDSFDVFVRDPQRKTTVRASLDSNDDELPGGVGSLNPDKDSKVAISGNGRFVAFSSFDVATGDSDFGFAVDRDVFVRDLKQGTTIRASLKTNGEEADPNQNAGSSTPSISRDGRYVAFVADAAARFGGAGDTNSSADVYVRDTQRGKTIRASLKTNGDEAAASGLPVQFPEISPNGRYVVFDTGANFGGGPDPGNFRDVYRRDLERKKTTLVSLKSSGGRADTNQLPDVANQAWVAFSSMAKLTGRPDDGNDFDVFLRGPLR